MKKTKAVTATENAAEETMHIENVAAKTGNTPENVAEIAALLKEKFAKRKPGRPVIEGSERQKRIAEMEAKRAAGIEVKRGRAIVPGSARQEKLAKLEAKKAAGMPIKPGRPKTKEDERVIELPEVSTEVLEAAKALLKSEGVELIEGI